MRECALAGSSTFALSLTHSKPSEMRSTSSLLLLTLAGSSLAFPAGAKKGSVDTSGCPFAAAGAKAKRPGGTLPALTFDSDKQRIDVTGKHAFQPPSASDKRVS